MSHELSPTTETSLCASVNAVNIVDDFELRTKPIVSGTCIEHAQPIANPNKIIRKFTSLHKLKSHELKNNQKEF